MVPGVGVVPGVWVLYCANWNIAEEDYTFYI